MITIQQLKKAIKNIKKNSYEGNDSHSCAEYRGICDGLDRLVQHFQEKEKDI
jgi:hypothetical protein